MRNCTDITISNSLCGLCLFEFPSYVFLFIISNMRLQKQKYIYILLVYTLAMITFVISSSFHLPLRTWPIHTWSTHVHSVIGEGKTYFAEQKIYNLITIWHFHLCELFPHCLRDSWAYQTCQLLKSELILSYI